MGPGAADIAAIVSEVREKLPGLEPPPTLEPEQARFRLFDSITTFLKNAAQSQPLRLVLDDLSMGRQAVATAVAVPVPRAGREPLVGDWLLSGWGVVPPAPPSETLVSELSAARPVRLHARIGPALEETYRVGDETHASELAHHFAEAEPILVTEKLVRYSLLAAERSLASHVWEEAQAHFERALSAKEGRPMDADTAALLFGLGRAKYASLEGYQAPDSLLEIINRASDFYVEAGNELWPLYSNASAHFSKPV